MGVFTSYNPYSVKNRIHSNPVNRAISLQHSLEVIPCPYCGHTEYKPWAVERGFSTVRCGSCDFLYLNPRPNEEERSKATQMGVHSAADGMDISEKYLPKKTERYQQIFADMFGAAFANGAPISWIDIGSGYGETIDAVTAVAPKGSKIYGVEPMHPKAEAAKSRGLDVFEQLLGPGLPQCDYASLIDVFSHINDFDAFLQDVRHVIKDGGEFFMETGHLDGTLDRADFPGVLGSPDHVAFATEKHIKGFLERNGFEVLQTKPIAIDGWIFTAKNLVKKILGRSVQLRMPHSSAYRTLLVRARKLP